MALNWKLARHAPAGRRIPLRVAFGRAASPTALWAGLQVNYFDSGTSALAIAIKTALRPLIEKGVRPRVLLPAYACPNLLAATLWAGGKPEYLDFEPESFAPSTERIASALRAGDAVVVCVDAFGIDSLGAGVGKLNDHERRFLIHDLAQSYAPFDEGWIPQAPFTIVSFGRAKPVSLTLGGALITTHVLPAQAIERLPFKRVGSAYLALRAAAYNLSLIPLLFGILAKISALRIGVTAFDPLQTVFRFDDSFARFARAAVGEYRAVKATLIDAAAAAAALIPQFDGEFHRALWRAPFLARNAARAETISLRLRDLGATRLYGQTVHEFEGAAAGTVCSESPHAFELSRNLITVPSHGRLRREDLLRIHGALTDTAAPRSTPDVMRSRL